MAWIWPLTGTLLWLARLTNANRTATCTAGSLAVEWPNQKKKLKKNPGRLLLTRTIGDGSFRVKV